MAGDWVKDARVLLEAEVSRPLTCRSKPRGRSSPWSNKRGFSKLPENEPRGGVAL